MKTILLAVGVAAAVLTAGSALAAARHPAMGAAVAAPKQPIPYAQLDSYLKASPAQRARKDWWSGQAATTGMATNTAASSPALANDTPTPKADAMPMATDAAAAPAEGKAAAPDAMLENKGGAAPANPVDKPH